MKKIIIVVIIILTIISSLFFVPRFRIISKFESTYGKVEAYENIIDGRLYLEKYMDLRESGISVKLPISKGDDLDFLITNYDYFVKCDGEEYEVLIIPLNDDILEEDMIDFNNELLLNFETIKEFSMSYLGIARDDLKLFQPINKLEFYYDKYGLKNSLLKEWGPKYCTNYINKKYEVITMFNDSIPDQKNYNVVTIIIYDSISVIELIPYKFIQISKKSDTMFTDEEVRTTSYALEVLGDDN